MESAPRAATQKPPAISAAFNEQAIAVLDFANVTGESDCAWLSAGVGGTGTGRLRGLGRFRVVGRGRVIEALPRSGGSRAEGSTDLHAAPADRGGYPRNG